MSIFLCYNPCFFNRKSVVKQTHLPLCSAGFLFLREPEHLRLSLHPETAVRATQPGCCLHYDARRTWVQVVRGKEGADLESSVFPVFDSPEQWLAEVSIRPIVVATHDIK